MNFNLEVKDSTNVNIEKNFNNTPHKDGEGELWDNHSGF